MATKIRGITVEIGGDTSGLQKALYETNKQIKDTQTELKDVDKLLKLDPTNTELLSQKQQILKQSLEQTAEKLESLKKAEQELKDAGVDENSTQFRTLQREIISTEEYLKRDKEACEEFNASVEKTKGSFEKVASSAQAVADKTAGISRVAQGALAVIAGIGATAISSYADYEQLVGGIDTLFGKSSKKVQQYANKAYKTAGVSANDYMELVTSFSASLISSLKGDTELATEYADLAITDMADNANKMGTDIESIQNAYKGFAKQTYTMLDNLKLGYGGTKAEMERLLADANEYNRQQGIYTNYQIENYNDIIDAIHVVQAEMGITGATAEEAEKTISGSLNATKASLQNLITGFADANADVDSLVSDLIENVKNLVANVMPVIQALWDNLPLWGKIAVGATAVMAVISPIASLISNLTTAIPNMVSILGKLANLGTGGKIALIASAIALIVTLIIENWDIIKPVLEDIWSKVTKVFNGIKDVVVSVFNTIKDAIKNAINAGIGFINGLISGINKLINGINKINFSIPSWVPNIGGKSLGFNIPNINTIPYLAEGGILSNGSAIVGERGAELLTINQGKAVVQPLNSSIGNSLSNIESLLGAGTNMNITVQSVLDGRVIGQTVYNYTNEQNRRFNR